MHHHPVLLTLCCSTLPPSLTHSPSCSSITILFLPHYPVSYAHYSFPPLHTSSCNMLFFSHHVAPPTLFCSSLTFLFPRSFSFAYRNYIATPDLVIPVTATIRLMAAYCTLAQCTGGGKDRQMASRPSHPRCRPTSDAFV